MVTLEDSSSSDSLSDSDPELEDCSVFLFLASSLTAFLAAVGLLAPSAPLKPSVSESESELEDSSSFFLREVPVFSPALPLGSASLLALPTTPPWSPGASTVVAFPTFTSLISATLSPFESIFLTAAFLLPPLFSLLPFPPAFSLLPVPPPATELFSSSFSSCRPIILDLLLPISSPLSSLSLSSISLDPALQDSETSFFFGFFDCLAFSFPPAAFSFSVLSLFSSSLSNMSGDSVLSASIRLAPTSSSMAACREASGPGCFFFLSSSSSFFDDAAGTFLGFVAFFPGDVLSSFPEMPILVEKEMWSSFCSNHVLASVQLGNHWESQRCFQPENLLPPSVLSLLLMQAGAFFWVIEECFVLDEPVSSPLTLLLLFTTALSFFFFWFPSASVSASSLSASKPSCSWSTPVSHSFSSPLSFALLDSAVLSFTASSTVFSPFIYSGPSPVLAVTAASSSSASETSCSSPSSASSSSPVSVLPLNQRVGQGLCSGFSANQVRALGTLLNTKESQRWRMTNFFSTFTLFMQLGRDWSPLLGVTLVADVCPGCSASHART